MKNNKPLLEIQLQLKHTVLNQERIESTSQCDYHLVQTHPLDSARLTCNVMPPCVGTRTQKPRTTDGGRPHGRAPWGMGGVSGTAVPRPEYEAEGAVTPIGFGKTKRSRHRDDERTQRNP